MAAFQSFLVSLTLQCGEQKNCLLYHGMRVAFSCKGGEFKIFAPLGGLGDSVPFKECTMLFVPGKEEKSLKFAGVDGAGLLLIFQDVLQEIGLQKTSADSVIDDDLFPQYSCLGFDFFFEIFDPTIPGDIANLLRPVQELQNLDGRILAALKKRRLHWVWQVVRMLPRDREKFSNEIGRKKFEKLNEYFQKNLELQIGATLPEGNEFPWNFARSKF